MKSDPNKPNSARIYDYMLDGTHNYPVDREIGDRNKRDTPVLVKFARLNRSFLKVAGTRFNEAGFSSCIDLATGLPTERALHEHLPETTKILYNDKNEEVVADAEEILAEYAADSGRSTANIRYLQARVEDIDTILSAADTFFGGDRRVGVCLIGVAYFIQDEELAHSCERLFTWCAPGSLLAVSSFDTSNDEQWQERVADYRRIGVELYPRAAAHLAQLIKPWQGEFQNLETIIETNLGTQVAKPEERGRLGYAGIFHRP